MAPAEFAAVLAAAGCYVVAPGHEPQTAEVVWGGDGYLVVRDAEEEPSSRSGEDGKVARGRVAQAPRRRRPAQRRAAAAASNL
jgi:hypothetical protein